MRYEYSPSGVLLREKISFYNEGVVHSTGANTWHDQHRSDGRLVSRAQLSDSGATVELEKYDYYPGGGLRMIERMSRNPLTDDLELEKKEEYDQSGNWVRSTAYDVFKGKILKRDVFSYDDHGNIVGKVSYDREGSETMRVSWTYGVYGLRAREEIHVQFGQADSKRISYDKQGRVEQIEETHGNDLSDALNLHSVETYTYDARDRVSRWRRVIDGKWIPGVMIDTYEYTSQTLTIRTRYSTKALETFLYSFLDSCYLPG